MEFWNKILNKLNENKEVVLLLVCSHNGSSPGKQGFKMMVCSDGALFGSIGGGETEFQMVEKAKTFIENNFTGTVLINQEHRENSVDSSGMICEGEQLVLLYPLSIKHKKTIQDIIHLKKGILSITKDSFTLDVNSSLEKEFSFKKKEDERWIYKENVNRKMHLYIIGGGHVALATSQLFSTLEFEICVFENRENINTFEDNSFADKKIIIDYNEITKYIPEGKNTYIVILTHAHEIDRLVLSKLFKKEYQYIGLLGSKSKVGKMFNAFINDGVDKRKLEKVDSPIGLSIGSKTPAEIAVSIAAKILSVKSGI